MAYTFFILFFLLGVFYSITLIYKYMRIFVRFLVKRRSVLYCCLCRRCYDFFFFIILLLNICMYVYKLIYFYNNTYIHIYILLAQVTLFIILFRNLEQNTPIGPFKNEKKKKKIIFISKKNS